MKDALGWVFAFLVVVVIKLVFFVIGLAITAFLVMWVLSWFNVKIGWFAEDQPLTSEVRE